MNNSLLFDFIVDQSTRTVTIVREFAAPQNLVWDAFTTADLLDQWVAPKPFQSKTKYMDFRVGGKRFYAMVSPEGMERWSIQEYRAIQPKTTFTMYNCFADKDENPELPGSEWVYTFSEAHGVTKVQIVITNESQERFDRVLQGGFREGFSMTVENLEKLLESLTR